MDQNVKSGTETNTQKNSGYLELRDGWTNDQDYN